MGSLVFDKGGGQVGTPSWFPKQIIVYICIIPTLFEFSFLFIFFFLFSAFLSAPLSGWRCDSQVRSEKTLAALRLDKRIYFFSRSSVSTLFFFFLFLLFFKAISVGSSGAAGIRAEGGCWFGESNPAK